MRTLGAFPCSRACAGSHARRVAALGLLGHTRAPLHAARVFSLEEQLAHVLRAVDAAPAEPPLTLVGHSIGAHLALRAMAARPARVARVVGLYPFLQVDPESRLLRVLAAAVRLRPLVWLVATLAGLLAKLPAALRRGLLAPALRGVVGLGDAAVAVTCDWLRAASVQNTCQLGALEFAALAKSPEWAQLRALSSRVALFYGPADDVWAPASLAAAVRTHAPGVAVVQDGAHGHMFCTTREGARYVAAASATMLRGLERGAAGTAGATGGASPTAAVPS